MATVLAQGKQYYETAAGIPLVGGKVFTYDAGTNNPRQTFSDAAGVTLNPNPVILDARGEAVIFWQGNYKVVLQDSLGNLIWTVDGVATPEASGASAALAALLASTALAAGAALVGSNDVGGYFNGTTVEAILQELGNGKNNQFQVEGVNVLRYIPPSEWAAILNGTSATNLFAYLQAALTAESNLIFPDGLFNTATKLTPRTDSHIHGINRRGTKLKGTAANIILEYPINSIDCFIENIWFCGSGTTGIAVATTGGTFHDYLIRPHISNCDFSWEMTYGINADVIYMTLDKSTFGFYGTVGGQPAAGTSTMTALRAFVNGGNLPNLNRVNDCNFAAGGLTAPAVDLSGGVGWVFTDCDWSFGGVAIRTSNIALLKFRGTCWFEGNNCTNGLIEIGATTTMPSFDGVNVSNNTMGQFIRYATSVVVGIELVRSEFSLNSPSYVMTDTTTLVNTLPGNGSVSFWGNHVTGGNAANKLVTGTDFRGGSTQPRFVAVCQTSGGIATLLSCPGDPGMALAYVGVGSAQLTPSQPMGSAANNVGVLLSGRSANAPRAAAVSTTAITYQAFNDAGAATDGIVTVAAYGA